VALWNELSGVKYGLILWVDFLQQTSIAAILLKFNETLTHLMISFSTLHFNME